MKKIILLITVNIVAFYFVKAQWLLTGNSIVSGNFIGTTNNANLLFKVNNVNSGLIDVTYRNTFFGSYSGGVSNNIAVNNSALGYSAMYSNTAGTSLVALGCYAMQQNTTAVTNTAVGFQSLYSNRVGNVNLAFGANSLFSLAPPANPNYGVENCGFGVNALFMQIDGSFNTVFGSNAMYFHTHSSGSTTIGFQAGYGSSAMGAAGSITAVGALSLHNLTGGGGGLALGYQSQYSATSSGSDDISIGFGTLYSNKTSTDNIAIGGGALHNTIGNDNIAIGDGALFYNIAPSPNSNLAIGAYALFSNISGFNNVAVGFAALGSVYADSSGTGNNNIGIGNNALTHNTTGSNNIAIGNGSGPTIVNLDGSIAVGAFAIPTANYEAIFGSSVITKIGGYVNWSNFSDGRYKKNVIENIPGLEFITKLRPLTYTLDVHAINHFILPEPLKGLHGENNPKLADNETSLNQKEKIVYSGLISQEVEVAAKKINYDFGGVVRPASDRDFYRLRYSDFIPSLSKAIVQLKNVNDSLTLIANAFTALLNNIQRQLDSLKTDNDISRISKMNSPTNRDLGINAKVHLARSKTQTNMAIVKYGRIPGLK